MTTAFTTPASMQQAATAASVVVTATVLLMLLSPPGSQQLRERFQKLRISAYATDVLGFTASAFFVVRLAPGIVWKQICYVLLGQLVHVLAFTMIERYVTLKPDVADAVRNYVNGVGNIWLHTLMLIATVVVAHGLRSVRPLEAIAVGALYLGLTATNSIA